MALDENDFLTFQLFTASKSPRIRRTRIKSWILTTMAFLCLAYLFFDSNNRFIGFYFLILSGFNLILYPFYSRWRYKKHYLNYIRDNYKNRFGEISDIEFNTKTIRTKDKTGEMIINKTEVEEINEIKDYYFIKARTGETIIISKTETDDLEKVKREIKSLIETNNIKYNVELEWKWK